MELSKFAFGQRCFLNIEFERKIINEQTGQVVVLPHFSPRLPDYKQNPYETFIFTFVMNAMKNVEMTVAPFYYSWNEIVMLLSECVKREVFDMEADPIFSYYERYEVIEKEQLLKLIDSFYILDSNKEVALQDEAICKANIEKYIIKLTLAKELNEGEVKPVSIPEDPKELETIEEVSETA
jgi:hypothetical protein